ncbi:TrmH family RNA methyltransferase [Aureispira anguillae]|uniref:RNA methyltransferase n=1 Tax=Aureispira anguillae TaxID=2864201 RepID=A0A915YBQ5_9BACT|nr:RNA methyltransferase [Aureispira anguillae]BDS10141.1 RNA methyltransferase [Aureispira anguillae]
MKHPRDQFLTIYGRKPVLEILQDEKLNIAKVFIAKKAKADIIKNILAACERRGIEVLRMDAAQVSRMSKHPKQDQGVAADIHTPQMDDALHFLEEHQSEKLQLIALDGITTPANVGMIIRSCTALGIDGIILPRKGCAKLNALVIKASAGVVFKSKILKCERLSPVLKKAQQLGFAIYGLSGEKGSNIYTENFAPQSLFVMGNETAGVSPQTEALTNQHLFIPMANGVESLNVACAATVVASEIMRRK